MAKIVIIGAGAMGSAFALPCLDNNHDINIVGTHLENDFIDQLKKKNNLHPGLNTKIPQEIKIFKIDKFDEILKSNVDLIVLGISSKGIEWVADQLSRLYKDENIPKLLMLTKGLSIHNNQYELLVDKLERLLADRGIKNADISAVGGPCLAAGLANRVHTSVVFANANIKSAQTIASLVSTNYYHVFISSDVIGVEICAAIKNIYSMIVGASEGLCGQNSKEISNNKNFLNTAASLIQQSINEMTIFVEKAKGKKETVMGLAGIGDLYVSADGGRNSKMGYYLGQGMSFVDAKNQKMKEDTVEGADLIMEIGSKVKKDYSHKELPLMISMIDTICNSKPLNVEWKNFKL